MSLSILPYLPPIYRGGRKSDEGILPCILPCEMRLSTAKQILGNSILPCYFRIGKIPSLPFESKIDFNQNILKNEVQNN